MKLHATIGVYCRQLPKIRLGPNIFILWQVIIPSVLHINYCGMMTNNKALYTLSFATFKMTSWAEYRDQYLVIRKHS